MGFPPPPKSNREKTPPPEPPPPPEFGPQEAMVGDYRLTDEETRALLEKYLTPTQLDDPPIIQFILNYVSCRNASQAARDAGIPGKGSWLMRKPEVYACIRAITDKALVKYGFDAEEVVERVKEIAGIDPVVFENPDGSYKTHLSQIPAEARRAIKRFKVKNLYGEDINGMRTVIGQLVEVELWDKMKSLELMGREKNIFKETKKIEHDVTSNMASLLLESKARAEQRAIEASKPVTELQVIDVPLIEGDAGDTPIDGQGPGPVLEVE